MAGISSLGIGSGIDIRSLVDQLVAAERAPVENRLNRRAAELQTELSAFGKLKSVLGGFRESVTALTDPDAFGQMRASSSDSKAVGVTASSDAAVGSFDVTVSNLAQAQSVASAAFTSVDDAVGSGTLTFRFGTVNVDGAGAVTGFTQNADRAAASVAIPASATSLADIRDAVNEADVGVRASIINDGSGQRLVFDAGDTGAGNGFVVEVADDDGDNTDAAGLSQLAFHAGASHLERTRAGEDAAFTVNGLAITRADNEVGDAIAGLTLDLQQITEGAAVSIDVTRDQKAVRGQIQDFVDGYNAFRKQFGELTAYDADTGRAGALQGNAVARTIEANLRRMVTGVVDALDGRAVRSLADLGITTTRDGTLEIDDARLDTALTDHFDEVGALFAAGGLVDGDGFAYEGSSAATAPGRYGVSVSQLAEAARVTGAALANPPSDATPLTIDAGNDALTLEVDGVTTAALQITHGDYTSASALATEIQTRINEDASLRDAGAAVTVRYDSAQARFEIVSERYGAESGVRVVAVDTNTAADLGFSAGQQNAGQDVAGTIAGASAEGSGRILAAAGGDADGLRVRVTGTDTGYLGAVTFSRGITAMLDDALGSLLESDGVLTTTTESLQHRLEDIGTERADLERRMQQVEARYVAEFSAMDQLVARLNQTSGFLSRQLSGLEAMLGNQRGSK